MFGDGTTRRDYTFVSDIVDGIVRAIDRCTSHHLYNLGNSDPIALKDLIHAIASALGKTPIIHQLPEQPGDVRQTYADISRAARTSWSYASSRPRYQKGWHGICCLRYRENARVNFPCQIETVRLKWKWPMKIKGTDPPPETFAWLSSSSGFKLGHD